MPISFHFRDCKSASSLKSISCKKRYSNYQTLLFLALGCSENQAALEIMLNKKVSIKNVHACECGLTDLLLLFGSLSAGELLDNGHG